MMPHSATSATVPVGGDPSAPHPGDAPRPPALRLGLRSIRGLGPVARERLERALADGPFTSPADVVHRTALDRRTLRLLAEAGAFDAMFAELPVGHRRRHALWAVLEAHRGPAGPLAPLSPADDPPRLPRMRPAELTAADYRVTGLSLHGHPMRHLRATVAPNGIRTARDLLLDGVNGQRVGTAGLVICRQRPGTAKGFVFLSLEDETGIINVVVTPKQFERQAIEISTSPLLLVRGTLQVEGAGRERVVNVRGDRYSALDASVGAEWAQGHDFH